MVGEIVLAQASSEHALLLCRGKTEGVVNQESVLALSEVAPHGFPDFSRVTKDAEQVVLELECLSEVSYSGNVTLTGCASTWSAWAQFRAACNAPNSRRAVDAAAGGQVRVRPAFSTISLDVVVRHFT